MKRRGGSIARSAILAAAVLAAGLASPRPALAVDPEFLEALSYSGTSTKVAEPDHCSSYGAPEGTDFTLAGIDAETRRLSTATQLDRDSFCNDPVAVTCGSMAVRGKYLAQIRGAIERMATAPAGQLPTPFPNWHPLVEQLKDRMKSYISDYAADQGVTSYCRDNHLNAFQCNCIRDGVKSSVASYLRSIQVFVGTPDRGICTAGSDNGLFNPRNGAQPPNLIICPVGILAAYDASGNPQEPGYANLVHLVSHELGHAFDPRGMYGMATSASTLCSYTQYGGFGASQVNETLQFSPTDLLRASYDATSFGACAKSFAPPEPPSNTISLNKVTLADQTASEIAADGFAAHILPYSINPSLSAEDVMSATVGLCDAANTPNTDGHPPGGERIQAYAKYLHSQICPNNPTNYGRVPACAVPH